MNKHGITRTLAAVVALALASAQAHAQTKSEQRLAKEAKIGMASGATIGALIGGPFGAGVGFIVGAMAGTGAGKYNDVKHSAQTLQQQLTEAQKDFAKLAESKAADAAENALKTESLLQQFAHSLRGDILFRTASAELDPNAVEKLGELGKVLGAYPDLVVDVDGFADPRGKSDSNDELSEQRAMAVRAALMVGGAPADRIHIVAHGEKLSTAAKDDLEAYAWERRVSLSVRPTSSQSQVAQSK